MRFMDQVKTALKKRTCAQCGGKGYVVDRQVDDFIQKYGLDTYQVATTMMTNEDAYGGRGSLGVSAWEMVGLTPDASLDFSTEVGLVHVLRACKDCDRHKDHPMPLHSAMRAIETLIEQRQAKFGEWLGKKEKEPAGE